jgi:hypothetical protein
MLEFCTLHYTAQFFKYTKNLKKSVIPKKRHFSGGFQKTGIAEFFYILLIVRYVSIGNSMVSGAIWI